MNECLHKHAFRQNRLKGGRVPTETRRGEKGVKSLECPPLWREKRLENTKGGGGGGKVSSSPVRRGKEVPQSHPRTKRCPCAFIVLGKRHGEKGCETEHKNGEEELSLFFSRIFEGSTRENIEILKLQNRIRTKIDTMSALPKKPKNEALSSKCSDIHFLISLVYRHTQDNRRRKSCQKGTVPVEERVRCLGNLTHQKHPSPGGGGECNRGSLAVRVSRAVIDLNWRKHNK